MITSKQTKVTKPLKMNRVDKTLVSPPSVSPPPQLPYRRHRRLRRRSRRF